MRKFGLAHLSFHVVGEEVGQKAHLSFHEEVGANNKLEVIEFSGSVNMKVLRRNTSNFMKQPLECDDDSLTQFRV
jgi:hypothetical protein